MAEKRRGNRLAIEMPVKCRILDRQKKNEISYEVVSKTRDLGGSGASLVWPKSWNCKNCLNCLAWIFNHTCILKEKSQKEEFNKYLTSSNLIQIEINPPSSSESIKIIGEVVWVRPENQKDSYKIGLSFSGVEAAKLEKLQGSIFGFKEN